MSFGGSSNGRERVLKNPFVDAPIGARHQAASMSLIGDAHPRTDAALTGPVTQLRVYSARNRRNRFVSVIPDWGRDPIVVAQLARRTSWRGGLRLADAQVRRCNTVGKCVDTQSAAGGDRRADRP